MDLHKFGNRLYMLFLATLPPRKCQFIYGNDCESGETPSHDSGDASCQQDGLSFIGVSFSVNTASGNPYSYQLCDQFPMENIIDRGYDYVMSMDEDGWLVGGGEPGPPNSYKLKAKDSSHVEIIQFGTYNPEWDSCGDIKWW